MACSGGKKRNKSAHNVKKCAISYVMLLNFLAYMYFCGARACIFLKRPYLCIVFFIVLDLRLTRLGYSGIPFFLSLCQDAPRCVRLERHMCHPVNLFAPKDFLPCRCWWGHCLYLSSLFFSFFFSFSRRVSRRDRERRESRERRDSRKRKCAHAMSFTRDRTAAGRVCRRPVWWQRCSKGRRRGV